MTGLSKKIQELYGSNTTVSKQKSVGGGSINSTSVLSLSNGLQLFLKQNSASYKGMFQAEVVGLQALRQGEGPRVPEPIALFEDNSHQFLLMEYLPSGRARSDYNETFGEQFARLHQTNTSEMWGFHQNNFIGATDQINTPDSNWISFFSIHRLGYQIELATKAGLLGSDLRSKLDRLQDKLNTILIEPEEAPTLIHGDLWSGNAMIGPNGEPVIIDPAVYYGHREADLAMTELFGRFHQRFYHAYNATWPLEPGYEDRKDLYNLYHMLNHLNLFGSGYSGSVRSIVHRYI